MKHTPPPWIADLIAIEDEDGVRCVQVYGPEGQGHGRVAQVYAECGRPEELWHNVRLVEATPDLLEACNDALIEICATCVYPDRPYDPESFPQLDNPEDRKCLANAITILRDAIAKARGDA